MGLTAAEAITFIGQYLGPAFAAANISTQILGYDHNRDDTTYPETVLSDTTAGMFVTGTAWHAYAGNVSAQTTVHNAFPTKDTWFTEISASQPGSFGSDLEFHMRNIVIGSPQNWAKGTMHWNIVLDENNGPINGGITNIQPVVTVNTSTNALVYYSTYYAITHASKVVKPGAIRVSCTTYGEGYINTVAYLNLDLSRVLIVECDAQSAQNFQVIENGYAFSMTLQPGDVQTFTWTA
jgi:glucosylceramidase